MSEGVGVSVTDSKLLQWAFDTMLGAVLDHHASLENAMAPWQTVQSRRSLKKAIGPE